MRTITRRALLGGSALAVGGAGALVAGERERGRRWLHAVGLLDSPDIHPPDLDIPVESHELQSKFMGRHVKWTLATPPDKAEAVVLCLHGRGGSHSFAFNTIGVHQFVAAEQLRWAVVGVDGGAGSYWHRRADGTDSQAMVFEELLPAVGELLGPTPLVLLGWSMGGYGALLAASEHPDEVAAVAATSPALWPTFARAAPGAFDGPADFRRHDLFSRVEVLREVPMRIDCGNDDPFAGVARAIAGQIPGAEKAFGPGFHDAASWRSRVPGQVSFFRRVLGA